MNWSYIVGFFDGEGCITRSKTYAGVTVRMVNTNAEVINVIGNFLTSEGFHPHFNTGIPKNKNHKQWYACSLSRHEEVLRFAQKILNLSIVKQSQLKEVIQHIETHDWWMVALEKLKKPELNKKKLIELYWEKNMSQREIAKMYNVTQSLVSWRMRRFNIPSRSFSAAQKIVWMGKRA